MTPGSIKSEATLVGRRVDDRFPRIIARVPYFEHGLPLLSSRLPQNTYQSVRRSTCIISQSEDLNKDLERSCQSISTVPEECCWGLGELSVGVTLRLSCLDLPTCQPQEGALTQDAKSLSKGIALALPTVMLTEVKGSERKYRLSKGQHEPKQSGADISTN